MPWLLLLMHHADCSDRIRHRCLSLVRSQGLAVLRIDQRSFAGQFARFEANSPSWGCPVALAAGVDSKRPCLATRAESRQTPGPVVPVQLPPASVVLAAIVDRICFKALQLFGCMQWGFLPLASPSPKQLQQSFHPLNVGSSKPCAIRLCQS